MKFHTDIAFYTSVFFVMMNKGEIRQPSPDIRAAIDELSNEHWSTASVCYGPGGTSRCATGRRGRGRRSSFQTQQLSCNGTSAATSHRALPRWSRLRQLYRGTCRLQRTGRLCGALGLCVRRQHEAARAAMREFARRPAPPRLATDPSAWRDTARRAVDAPRRPRMRHRQLRHARSRAGGDRGVGHPLGGIGADLDRPLAGGRTARRIGTGSPPPAGSAGTPRDPSGGGGGGNDQGILLRRGRSHRPWRLRQLRGLDRAARRHPPAAAAVARQLDRAAVARTRRDIDRQRVHRIVLGRRTTDRIDCPRCSARSSPRSAAFRPAAAGCCSDSHRAAEVRHCRRQGIRVSRRCRTSRADRRCQPGCCRADRTDRRPGCSARAARRRSPASPASDPWRRRRMLSADRSGTRCRPTRRASPSGPRSPARRTAGGLTDIRSPRIIRRTRRRVVSAGVRGIARRLLGGAMLRRMGRAGRKQPKQGHATNATKQRRMRRKAVFGVVVTRHPRQTSVVVARPQWPEGTAAGWPSLR